MRQPALLALVLLLAFPAWSLAQEDITTETTPTQTAPADSITTATTPTTTTPAPAPPPPAASPPKAHKATPGSVTMKDFSFGPSSVTVNAGEAVTWTNQGPTKHSATADDGSFDTGLLSKGKSASHTFNKAGTFAYVCSIHPNMHGTVRVVAAGSGSGNGATSSGSSAAPSSSSSSSSSSGGSSASTAKSGPSLPKTGGHAAPLALLGLVLLGAGLLARRRAQSG
jgi:LPXTG-motif cell wall-anchored protein